jgi:hypothetical protein
MVNNYFNVRERLPVQDQTLTLAHWVVYVEIAHADKIAIDV